MDNLNIGTAVTSPLAAADGSSTSAGSVISRIARGLNVWSVAADGSSTKRLFDNDHAELDGLSVSLTGSVVQTIRNASRSGEGFPSTDVPTRLPADRNADGGSLTTTVVRDILGRVQQSLSPGGVGATTTREMRTNPSRPNFLYYAEVSLPFSLGSSQFDGPAVVRWMNAGNSAFETRGYRLTGEHSAADPDVPYRQVWDDYSLDTSGGGLTSRDLVEHDVAGLVQARRRWHDPNATSGGFYETSYTYDALGRLDEATGPTGTITKAGRPAEGSIDAEPGYDFLDRPKVRSVSTTGATGSPKWTVVSRSHYDSVPDGDDDVDMRAVNGRVR